MSNVRKLLIGFLIMSAFGATALGVDPLNRLFILSRTGETSPGNFPIGALETDLEMARSTLESYGLAYGREVATGRCANVEVGTGQRAHLFHDRSWRRGVFCLFEDDGDVIRVAWWMSPGAP